MNTIKEINLHAERTFPHEDKYLKVKASAYKLGNNSHPHFSVTGETKHTGGCIHDDCAKAWPLIKPIIRLHLSNADNGEPMYALENGWYWITGATGGQGEQYHGGQGKTDDECLQIFADMMRISFGDAKHLAFKLRTTPKTNRKREFEQWIEEQKPRWQQEANEGIELLKELSR